MTNPSPAPDKNDRAFLSTQVSPANPPSAPTDEAITEAVRIEFNHPEDEAAVQRVARHIANLYATLQRPTQSTREQGEAPNVCDHGLPFDAPCEQCAEETDSGPSEPIIRGAELLRKFYPIGEAPGAKAVARLEQCAEWLRIARVRVVGESTEEHLKEFDYIADVIFEVIITLRSVPVPAPGVMVTDERVISGAAAIVDVWMGKDRTWRERLARGDGDFLESADWQNAMCLSLATLSAALRPKE